MKTPLAIATALGLCLMAAGLTHDFPVNDDWVYAKDVWKSGETLSLTGFESAWGLPQLFIAWKAKGFLLSAADNWHAAMRLVTVGCGLLNVFLLFQIFRRSFECPKFLTVSLFSVSLFLPFFALVPTFMTDVMSLSFILLNLLLIENGLRTRRPGVILFAALAACMSIAQRQVGIFPSAALGMYALWMARMPQERRFWITTAVICLLPLLGYKLIAQWWYAQTGTAASLVPFSYSMMSVIRNIHFCVAIPMLALFPAAVLVSERSLWRMGPATVVATLFTLVSLARHGFDPQAPFLGNLVSTYGFFLEYEVLPGTRSVYFPLAFRVLLSLAASFSFAVWVHCLEKKLRERNRKVPLLRDFEYVVIGYSLMYVAFVIFRGVVFDRYLLLAMPGFLSLFSLLPRHSVNALRWSLSGVAVVVWASLSIVVHRDFVAESGAKWQAAEFLLQFAPATEIEGGYEWKGWNENYPAHMVRERLHEEKYLVSHSLLESYRIEKTFPYPSFWGERQVYALIRED